MAHRGILRQTGVPPDLVGVNELHVSCHDFPKRRIHSAFHTVGYASDTHGKLSRSRTTWFYVLGYAEKIPPVSYDPAELSLLEIWYRVRWTALRSLRLFSVGML
jgi:hypothetical protein